MSETTASFLGKDGAHDDYASAEIVVLPVPFERTTSYGKGTGFGPEAMVRASGYVELYDEELDLEVYTRGVHTLAPFVSDPYDVAEALTELEGECRRHLEAGKLLVVLGGEHSLTLAPVRAARAVYGEIGVLQFDAHADLRDRYEGTPYSHACVMRRIHELGIPSAAIGLRALSKDESVLIREERIPVLWGYELDQGEARIDALLDTLPERVYLTFDIDYFDASLVPATGTPEPGGGFWTPTLRLLRRVFERKDVVALDVVELAPIDGQAASDFVAAKLVYKCLGYREIARR